MRRLINKESKMAIEIELKPKKDNINENEIEKFKEIGWNADTPIQVLLIKGEQKYYINNVYYSKTYCESDMLKELLTSTTISNQYRILGLRKNINGVKIFPDTCTLTIEKIKHKEFQYLKDEIDLLVITVGETQYSKNK